MDSTATISVLSRNLSAQTLIKSEGHSEDRLMKIIDICENYISGQNKSVEQIVSLCSKIFGYEFYCNQIVSFCHQILSDSLNSGNAIINICQSFSHLDLSETRQECEENKIPAPIKVDDIRLEPSFASSTTSLDSEVEQTNDSKPFQVTIPQNNLINAQKIAKKRSRKSLPMKCNLEPDEFIPNTMSLPVLVNQSTDMSLSSSEITRDIHKNICESNEETCNDKGHNSPTNDFTELKNDDETQGSEVDDVDDDADDDPDWIEVKEPKETSKKKKITSERPSGRKEIQCQFCTRKFKSVKVYRVHLNAKHWNCDWSTIDEEFHRNKEFKYSCSTCSKPFKTEALLNRHEKTHLKGEKTKCDICNKVMTQKCLRKHRQIHTGDRRQYVCEYCGSVFKDPGCLRSHLFKHTGVKNIACEFCDYKCCRKSSMRSHFLIMHSKDRKYQCEHCGKKFPRPGGLRVHLLCHVTEKLFGCDVCPARFARPSHLKRHKTTHREDNQYTCEICGHQSRQASNIRIHMRTHTGDKPFSCEKCGKKFAHNVTRKQHLKLCNGKIETETIVNQLL
ncbi:zinc finger protein 626 [Patella vulgata]|uniref:zinc finger protein 626 n=1 Tax=Patella vulgata TaxID=6465 RepID=UPI00217F24DF|nr:zinc finger protein 626 [Patella vulgata]